MVKMLVEPGHNPAAHVLEFFDYIYGEDVGFLYVARKNPNDGSDFRQDFFQWPSQKESAAQFVLDNRAQWEVYTAPALYEEPNKAGKANVKSARVFWCEFDGKVPESLDRLPRPTLRIRSSGEGHEHWYWRLTDSVDPERIEAVNRAVTYLLGADASGWDATQILRPPGTFNHKRQREVSLIEADQIHLDPDLFTGLPQPPPPVVIERPESIPDQVDVIAKYKFDEETFKLFRYGVPEGQRSTGEMKLGFMLAEMGLSAEEMLAILLNADDRWGKFKGRDDQVRRLLEIVTIAKTKHPGTDVEIEWDDGSGQVMPETELSSLLTPYGFLSLLRTEVQIEWIWQDFLQRNGYILVSGPSQVGKTQFTLDAACHFALGKPFLEHFVKETKVGFLSLEMGLTDIKQFMITQEAAWTDQEKERLEEMFLTFPMGEPLNLSNNKVLIEIDQMVGDLGLGGLMIDSLGEATDETLSDEAFRLFFDRLTRLRIRHNCFTWIIHHNRKGNGDNKKANKLSDVFGSQYITSKATTVLSLFEGSYANSVEVRPLKVRLAKRPDPFHIQRDQNLHFTYMPSGIAKKVDSDEEGRSVQLATPEQTPVINPDGTIDVDTDGLPTPDMGI